MNKIEKFQKLLEMKKILGELVSDKDLEEVSDDLEIAFARISRVISFYNDLKIIKE